MITPQQLIQAGIFQQADAQDCLWAESGLGWLKVHTTLPLEQLSLEQLPAGAKLFLQKYADVMESSGIASESIEGLSQSFTGDNAESQLLTLAQNLLPEWFRAIQFMPKQQRWTYDRKGGRPHD